METITNNNMNSIADEIYNQSRLLTTNLRAKGISNIDASMGLNTLINKVLLINPETPTTTTLETRITHNLKNGYGINKPFNINGKLLVINTTNNTLIGYLQNTPIQIYDGNNLIGTCITDNQGEYNLTFTPKNTGTINLKIVFEGNQYYESSSTTTIPINIYNYNNITLTITDTILSYENDDTTTLTAQIQLNGNNIQQENILVKFYESDDDCLIGESYTDSNGLATYTYESQGKGDLNIHAKIDNITSNTVNIEDCIYYNPNTISSTQTLNITKNIPTNFKTEYIAKLNSRTVWVEIGADNNNCLLFGSTGDSGKQLGEYVRVDGSYETYKGISCLPNTSENSIVYTYYNGEQTVTSNDNTTRLNNSTITDRTYLATHVESGYIKELKIKPYSPKTEYGLSAYLPSNVISYNDDESCTIDVQLMKNNYPYKKSGETVELNLINSKGEILSIEDTQITDEDGQCTLTYDSKGYGDIQLRIDYNDTSIIYDIEDCLKYDDASIDKSSNYSSINLSSLTHNTDHYEAYRSISGSDASKYYSPIYVDETLPNDFEIEVMINSNQTNVEQDMLTIAPNHPQTYSGANEIGIVATSIRYGLFSRSNGSGTFYTTSGHLNSNTWYKYYLKVEGTSVTGKIYDVNGNVLHSATQTLSSAQSYKKWNIIVGGESQTVQWKNLKIKELNNIQISNTKDILSYKDNDSTTITAVVDNPVCIGKPIVFTVTDKNDEIVDVYSTIVDDTGVVDYTYNSQGRGDLTVTVESMFLKETYKIIEDCSDYQSMTSNAKQSRWIIPNNVSSSSTFGYTSNGWKFGNVSSYSTISYDGYVNRPFSMEFTITGNSGLQPIFGAYFGSSFIMVNRDNNILNINVNGNHNNFNVSYPSTYTVRYELTNNNVSVYIDDTLIGTVNHNLTGNSVPSLQTGSNRYTVMKDFKIKPL